MLFFVKRPQSRPEAFGSGPRPVDSRIPKVDSLNSSNLHYSDPASLIKHQLELKVRQAGPPSTEVSTCGYLDGNVTASRTANPGFDCRVDTLKAIWGFCPTTVISPGDCGLAGGCVDVHACTSGCGNIHDDGATIITCSASSAQYCSTALLIDGPDQTYTYLACSSTSTTATYFNTPTATSSQLRTSSGSALSGAKPSLASASSTPLASSSTQSTPSSTAPPAISSTLASPSSLSASKSSPSNDIGAIVGGVLGGLALLSFLIVAFLFYRRLKKRHVKEAQDQQPVWEKADFQGGSFKKAPKQELIVPAELPTDGPAAELSGGRRGETTELPNNLRRSRHELED